VVIDHAMGDYWYVVQPDVCRVAIDHAIGDYWYVVQPDVRHHCRPAI
jgi:uncharacterized membrane protein